MYVVISNTTKQPNKTQNLISCVTLCQNVSHSIIVVWQGTLTSNLVCALSQNNTHKFHNSNQCNSVKYLSSFFNSRQVSNLVECTTLHSVSAYPFRNTLFHYDRKAFIKLRSWNWSNYLYTGKRLFMNSFIVLFARPYAYRLPYRLYDNGLFSPKSIDYGFLAPSQLALPYKIERKQNM